MAHFSGIKLENPELFLLAPLEYNPGSALFYQIVASGHFLIGFEFATIKGIGGCITYKACNSGNGCFKNQRTAYWRRKTPLLRVKYLCEFQNFFSFFSAVIYSLLPYSQCISRASQCVISALSFFILSILCANES